MNKRETRRIFPSARVAAVLVGSVLIFEFLVVGGVLELPAATIGRYAPWAYDSFVALVGARSEPVVFSKGNESALSGEDPLVRLFKTQETNAIPSAQGQQGEPAVVTEPRSEAPLSEPDRESVTPEHEFPVAPQEPVPVG